MTTSSHPSPLTPLPKGVLNPMPISFAPPSTEALKGISSPFMSETDSGRKSKKSKNSKPTEESPAVSTESKQGKKPKSDEDAPTVSTDFKRPDWLPEDWKVELHIREVGKTAGSKDKYYINPVTGKKLRSLVEVRRELGLDGHSKPNEKDNSPKSKTVHSGEVSASKKKESKKRLADNEIAASSSQNKGRKMEDGEQNGVKLSAAKPKEV